MLVFHGGCSLLVGCLKVDTSFKVDTVSRLYLLVFVGWCTVSTVDIIYACMDHALQVKTNVENVGQHQMMRFLRLETSRRR